MRLTTLGAKDRDGGQIALGFGNKSCSAWIGHGGKVRHAAHARLTRRSFAL